MSGIHLPYHEAFKQNAAGEYEWLTLPERIRMWAGDLFYAAGRCFLRVAHRAWELPDVARRNESETGKPVVKK